MMGKRIYLALEALKLFLHSIPYGSKFNVIRYGTDYNILFPRSMECDDNVLDIALHHLKDLDADMGGTEIFEPLSEVFKTVPSENTERHIYLLTDGAIFNTQEVIDLISVNKRNTRVHTFGMGDGASSELI